MKTHVFFPYTHVNTSLHEERAFGKHYLYQQSSRSVRPFLKVNCSAPGDTLLEFLLFGYLKAAFTDAKEDTKGIYDFYPDNQAKTCNAIGYGFVNTLMKKLKEYGIDNRWKEVI